VSVVPCGIFVDPDHGYLGASPDGLIGDDRLIEVKTIPSINNLQVDGKNFNKIRDAAKVRKLFVAVDEHEHLYLKKSSHYFYQIQGQLNITNRSLCDLVLFTDHDREVITVERDRKFWVEIMVPKLSQFYLDCLLPELVDSRDLRGMRVRDPPSVIEAQEKRGSACKRKLPSGLQEEPSELP
jgi:YqaJ-like viral recombinase domain